MSMKKLFLIFLLLSSITVNADKKPLIEDYDEVVATAKTVIEKSMEAPEGELYLFVQENNISGRFEFELTIHEKGLVATVFVKSNAGGSIQSQNKLKDFVKNIKFDFKMPKGKSYKFSYLFNFS
jgi:hypothetical protein